MCRNTIYTTENNRYRLIKKNILSPHCEIFSSFSLEISGMWQFSYLLLYYYTWKSVFISHVIGKMSAGCNLETCWLQPRCTGKESNPFKGPAVAVLLCRVTRRSPESLRLPLLTTAWLCARPKTPTFFWGHLLNPKDKLKLAELFHL